MALLYFIILVCALRGMRPRSPADGEAALAPEQTTMVKGIFVLLVFASHVSGYLALPSGLLTTGYTTLRSFLGQLIVVPFLFYSGYGIRLSLERKGNAYLRTMPRKRILTTYAHTVLILLVFLSVQLLFGHRYQLKQLLLSFLLLRSFGNSNWYLFAILFLYLATYLSFRWFSGPKRACAFCFALCAGYFAVFCITADTYWYDTIFVYFFGLIYPDLRKKAREAIPRFSLWLLVCLLLAAAVLALKRNTGIAPLDGAKGNLRGILFMLLLNVFLERFSLGNRILQGLGKRVFLCYLLQRLPMIVLQELGLGRSPALFVPAAALFTVALVLLFERLLALLDKRLFPAAPTP